MKKGRRILIICLCLAIVFMFFQRQAAAQANLPLLDFSGSFTYLDSSEVNGPKCNNANECRLDFNNLLVTKTDLWGGYDGTLDSIVGASVVIDPIYNGLIGGNVTNSLHFEGFGGSDIGFSIVKGGNTYLTGTLSAFDIETSPSGPTRLVNPGLNTDNISLLTLNLSLGSEYMNQLDAANDSGNYPANLYIPFSFTSASDTWAFTNSGSGTIGTAKLMAAPEPISAILFFVGSIPLAVRRFFLGKK